MINLTELKNEVILQIDKKNVIELISGILKSTGFKEKKDSKNAEYEFDIEFEGENLNIQLHLNYKDKTIKIECYYVNSYYGQKIYFNSDFIIVETTIDFVIGNTFKNHIEVTKGENKK